MNPKNNKQVSTFKELNFIVSEAVEKLEHALEIQPSNPNVFNVLINSLRNQKKYKEAWGAVKRARKAKVAIPKNLINGNQLN